MSYWITELEDTNLPMIVLEDGTQVVVPLFSVESVSYTNISEMPETEGAAMLWALQVVKDLVHTHVEALMDKGMGQKGEHVTLVFRQMPKVYCADKPPHPVYDPPAEWDEDEECMVIPEGARLVGMLEAAVGWWMQSIVGVVASKVPPLDALDAGVWFPLWTSYTQIYDGNVVEDQGVIQTEQDLRHYVWKQGWKGIENRMAIADYLQRCVRIGAMP